MAFPTEPQTSPRASAPRGTFAPWVVTASLVLAGCGSDSEPAPPTTPAPTAAGATTMGAAASGPQPGIAIESAGEDSGQAPAIERKGNLDLRQFVPDNAVAYFECSSLDDLEAAVMRLNNAMELSETLGNTAALATMPLVNVGIDPSRIDRNAPIAMAFAPVPGELFPSPIFVAPALDNTPVVNSASALTARGLKARRVADGYIVVEPISLGPATPRGAASVTQDLLEGVLSGHFDTETFIPLLAPGLYEIADRLNENYRVSRPKTSAKELYEFDADPILEALREPRALAFGVALDADQATVSLRFVGDPTADGETGPQAPAEAVSAALNELCQYISDEDPLSSLVSFHSESAARNIASLMDSVNERAASRGLLEGLSIQGETFLAMGDAIEKMLTSFQPGASVSMQFEPAKAHLAIYLATDDPTRARDAISLLLSKCEYETWGFEMALPIRSMMERTLVEDYSVRFDTRRLDFDQRAKTRTAFKTLLGDSSLHLKVATSDHHVLILLGGDTLAVNSRIRDFSTAKPADRNLLRAIAAVDGADSTRIYQTDFVRLFGQVAGLKAVAEGKSVAETYRQITREIGEGSAPFTGWRAKSGGDTLLGATFPLEALSKAFDAFKGAKL